jgi:hypothetical protein
MQEILDSRILWNPKFENKNANPSRTVKRRLDSLIQDSNRFPFPCKGKRKWKAQIVEKREASRDDASGSVTDAI